MVGEQIPRVPRATMTAGPARRVRLHAMGARFGRAKLRYQLFTQFAQPQSELFLGMARDAGTGLCQEPTT